MKGKIAYEHHYTHPDIGDGIGRGFFEWRSMELYNGVWQTIAKIIGTLLQEKGLFEYREQRHVFEWKLKEEGERAWTEWAVIEHECDGWW